jgi:hypothetical protein
VEVITKKTVARTIVIVVALAMAATVIVCMASLPGDVALLAIGIPLGVAVVAPFLAWAGSTGWPVYPENDDQDDRDDQR